MLLRLSSATIFLLFLLLVSAHVTPCISTRRHVITFSSPSPSSLLFDASSQHFVVGSVAAPPTITAVSDAGVVETLVHDRLLPQTSSLASLSLDRSRRRLLAAIPDPPLLAAYDLASHRRVFLSSLPFRPSAVAVDASSGAAYVAAKHSGDVWKVDVDGKASAFSRSEVCGGGIDAMVYVPKGFLLAVQNFTGNLFRIDAEDGRTRVVSLKPKILGAIGIAMKSDGSAVVVNGKGGGWILRSQDGFESAGVYDEIAVPGGQKTITRAVAVRERRKIYLLCGGEEEGRWTVEEVESEREESGEWIGAIVMLGVGLVLFLYWRFQMKQLVSNLNKKTA